MEIFKPHSSQSGCNEATNASDPHLAGRHQTVLGPLEEVSKPKGKF